MVYLGGEALVELDYPLGSPLQHLLSNIPDNRKTKISLVLSVLNLEKEEARTLTLPLAPKRAKSPSRAPI